MTDFLLLLAGFVVGCIVVYFIQSHKQHRQLLEHEKRIIDLRKKLEEKLNHEVEAVKLRVGKRAALDADKKLEGLAKDLLPVLDSMQMALQMQTQNIESLKSGVQMISDRLESTLHKHGCEMIVPEVGHPYDPSLHEAVTCVGEPEHVLAIQRVGFRVGEKVVRPAAVDVGSIAQENQEVTEPEEVVVAL